MQSFSFYHLCSQWSVKIQMFNVLENVAGILPIKSWLSYICNIFTMNFPVNQTEESYSADSINLQNALVSICKCNSYSCSVFAHTHTGT